MNNVSNVHESLESYWVLSGWKLCKCFENNGKTFLHTIYYARIPFIAHHMPVFLHDATVFVLKTSSFCIEVHQSHAWIQASYILHAHAIYMHVFICTYYNKNRIIFHIFTAWLVCDFFLAIGSERCQYKPNVRDMWAVKWTLITLCLVSVTEFRSCISTSLKFSLANAQTTEFKFDWLLRNELKWKNETWMYP